MVNIGADVSVASSIGAPAPITKSSERHRTPSPIVDNGEGLGPIAAVLEGMRTQRMSLVQSLRQYLFVHKGE
jgi:protein-tyrosine phosphatase